MKNKKIIFGIVILLLISLVFASIVQAEKFRVDEAIHKFSSSASNILKNSVFKWYTQTGGELNPAYETQRKAVDLVLFFILFFSLSMLGLRMVFKEGGNAVIGLSFAIGALLSLALIAFTKVTLGILFPFAKNLIFFIIVLVIYAVIAKVIGADKGGKKFLALILAVIIALVAFKYIDPEGSWNPFGKYNVGGKQETNYIDKVKELTEGGNGFGGPAEDVDVDKWSKYKHLQGEYEATTKRDFEKAANHFGDVVMEYPNDYWDKSYNWLTEKLWIEMQRENLKLMQGYLIAGEYYNRYAGEAKSEAEKKQLIDLADKQYDTVIKAGEQLEEEIKRQKARINDAEVIREMIRQEEAERLKQRLGK